MWEAISGYRFFRFWIMIIVLFIMSGVKSCSELKHSLWGITTVGSVANVQPSQYDRNDQYVTLMFDDDKGETQIVKRTIASSIGSLTSGDEVPVIYLSGSAGRARLVAERSFVWPYIFFGMIGLVVVSSIVLYRRMEADSR